MSKKFVIINIIILLFYLITFIKSQDPISIIYDFTDGYTEKQVSSSNYKKGNFSVEFPGDLSRIPLYIKVQVTSDDNNPAPQVCFSNSDPKCLTRDLLVKNPNDKMALLWLKREHFENQNKFYITVETENIGCSYTIRIEGDQIAILKPNFSYSYLVSNSKIRSMDFEIDGTENNLYMTVALDGSYSATLSIDESYQTVEKYKSGSVTTFYLENNGINSSKLATINIRYAEVGEFITLSVHLIEPKGINKGDAQNGLILPNGPEFTGLLGDRIQKECFPIDLSNEKYRNMNKLYITGRIHTKYAMFYLENENRQLVEDSKVNILNGQLGSFLKNNGKLNYICFELPSENEDLEVDKMMFSFSLTEPNSLSDLYNYYPPQLTGEIYRRIIPKGSIAFFSGTKNDNSAQKYDYSLYQIKGVTKMFIDYCKTYPNCHTQESQLANLVEPKNINQMYIWTTFEDKSSAIGNEKYIIVAQCLDDDNENNGFCEFETSIVSKGQDITLIENEEFSKFVINEEKGSFIANLQNGVYLQRLTFDIIIHSGDVTFTVRDKNTNKKLSIDEDQISYTKYYLSNKIFIHFIFKYTTIDNIIIDYEAITNSFFTIKYSYNSHNYEQLSEAIPSGESYLVQIDPTSQTKTKTIYLLNKFYKNKNQYLANFFELNCEFEIKRGNTDLKFFDGYAQEILNKTLPEYDSPNYKYEIKITEIDSSTYNHKMCMLYVAGYEAETEKENEREIVISNNINQQIIFNNNFKKIRFLYPYSFPEQEKNLALHVNVIDKAFYKVTIFINYDRLRELTITRSDIIYIKYTVISNKCTVNSLCPITIQVVYDSEIIKTEPMIEITIRETKNIPSYLQKGQAKLDFVCGDNFYYLYTDIGKNELAEITVNFHREFGNVWGKVVKKDQAVSDTDPNWRGIYRMPSESYGDSLPFNKYTKKLLVNSEDTSECIEGCYLLLSLQISQIGELLEDHKFYPFSIITRITPDNRGYTDVPKVVIQVDEFVIGNVDLANNDKIFEFFEVWLPHDSEIVLFDWQSSVAGLYINVGGIRPTTKNADFKLLPPGKDSILNLTKNEIIEKAKKKIVIPNENSLQDINLVIGIWTDKIDSISTEIYSLRIHQPDSDIENNLDITEINTDQKILCNPTRLSDNEYRCLFVVIYDDEDVNLFTPLLVYGGSLNHGALNYIYANYINRNIYDEFIRQELITSIPTYQTALLNSRKDGTDYIYQRYLEKGKYMYININTDKPDPLMIVTSMPIYNYIEFDDFNEFYPNPTTEQLLSVPGKSLRLQFPCTESVMVNIITLNGHAEISWKNDPYTVFVMRGKGDRINLSSGNKIDELIINNLDNNIYKNEESTMEDPGFVFYVSYFTKDNSNKFDEINYGKSLEIAYKDVDLPIFLYSKIGSEYRDINIAITFKDNEIDQKGILDSPPLEISAQLVKESIIYQAKSNPDLAPLDRSIDGYYDSALKTAQIFLSEEIIDNYNIKDSDNPTIFIKINKKKEGDYSDKIFEKFNIEAQVSGVNDGVIPVEKAYHYGRVRNSYLLETLYRLKTDKNRQIMRIQIAFNSDNLDFVVSDIESVRRNTTFLHCEKDRGKIYVTLKIKQNIELYYLYIYKKQNADSEEYLNNYAFKYFNVKDESEIFDYYILKSPEITYSESKEGENDIISCTFNKIDIEKGEANITYFFKVVENSTYHYGEECNTIAVTESPYYTTYERNPKDNNGEITLTAKGKLSNWVYLNVIAQVQQNNVIEYISYNGKMILRPSPDSENNNTPSDNDSGTDITLFLITGGILVVILLGLIIAIILSKVRNRRLLEQVKNVSFQKTNNNTDPNLLLQNK